MSDLRFTGQWLWLQVALKGRYPSTKLHGVIRKRPQSYNWGRVTSMQEEHAGFSRTVLEASVVIFPRPAPIKRASACKRGTKNSIEMRCTELEEYFVLSNRHSPHIDLFWFICSLVLRLRFKVDVHESVHHDIIMNTSNKMQLYRLIYYS